MRSLISFPCLGDLLIGTLDSASGETGLMIVSEANEIRSGPHRSMAQLAHRIAAAGYPVLRFDRRGVGDSAGVNCGFLDSGPDIATAAKTFRREAQLRRLVAFGNGDAASALALFHREARIDALLLANPAIVGALAGPDDAEPEAQPARGWMRQMLGRVGGRRPDGPPSIAGAMATALTEAEIPITLLLATRDETAAAFADVLHRPAFAAAGTRIRRKQFDTASHVFAGTADKAWLYERVIEALAEQRAP
ncbi:serine aminopeptidase domain-containing protein [Sphingomonas sp. R1]|uniref:serine aminopeptidase domain-containing protein n=1 Tax=Sphingomonas sp. R1 TaxID=399176 RepID=UPI0022251F17|nr:alpha/beta hydrolase [Sphingomonas sp. R1]UYY78384.1 alpha/beta hydrolase [Sphingomonas sp. R1]